MNIVSTVTSEVFLSLLFFAGIIGALWAIMWVGVQLIGNLIYYFGKGKDE